MLQCSIIRSIAEAIIKKEQNMSTPKKSTYVAGEKECAFEEFLPLYSKNVERLAELQKKSLEIASEQNTEFIGVCKKAFRLVPETPGLFFFDLFEQTFERVVETQKDAIELAVEQSNAIANLAKERNASVEKFTEGMTEIFKKGVKSSVEAQKKALDTYSEQYKSVYENAKKQFRASNPLAESFQSGLDALIETQKSVLDIASEPLKRAKAAAA
jgi:methyl-accepting chemotaxis protein